MTGQLQWINTLVVSDGLGVPMGRCQMVSGGCHMVLVRTNSLLKVSDGLGTESDGLGNVYVYV